MTITCLAGFPDTWLTVCTGMALGSVEVSVAKVNYYAPLSNRLLVDFRGKLPKGFNPMKDLEEFKPIGGTDSGRESESGDEETLVADLHAIGLRSAELLRPGPSAVEHGDFLYDDQGLPR